MAIGEARRCYSASAGREASAVAPKAGGAREAELAEAPAGAIRFTVAASGNAARYRVREH
jgi:hypothetical protein